MEEIGSEHTLSLTEDEAMGLLDIVMLSPTDLTPDQRAAAEKLSNFCREMIRNAAAAKAVGSGSTLAGTAATAFAAC